MKRALLFLWTGICLVSVDAAITLYAGFPGALDEMDDLNSVRRYFLYGTSAGRKIDAIMASSGATPLLMQDTGWIEEPDQTERAAIDPEIPKITIYGMSFSQNVGNQLKEIEPDWDIRLLQGPGSTPNRTFAQFLSDRPEKAQIVVFGILASTVPMLGTVSYRTWSREVPMPHLYPKFSLDETGNNLVLTPPPASTLSEFRTLLQTEAGQESLRGFLATHDSFYDPFVDQRTILDYSTMIRLVRRAYGQRQKQEIIGRFYSPETGFTNHANQVTVLRMMVREFIGQARADGQTPVVLLFNDRGYSDHLFQALADLIEETGVPYISSHRFLRADEFDKFRPDGHFKPEYDRQIAECLRDLIISSRSGLANRSANCPD
jgi:hypothetical protein